MGQVGGSLLREARELAKTAPKSIATETLLDAADHLQEAYDIIKVSCSRDAISDFIAATTRVLVQIEYITHPRPPAPPAGTPEVGMLSKTIAVAGVNG